MTKKLKQVCVIGAVPPPVHGFSAVTLFVINRLKKVTEVVVFDRTPRQRFSEKKSIFGSLISYFYQLTRFLNILIKTRPKYFYFGLSGGLGLYIDLIFVILIRLAGGKILFHHHNFTYINKNYFSMSILLKIAGDCSHILLCDCMKEKYVALYEKYFGSSSDFNVISNHAFVGLVDIPSAIMVYKPKSLVTSIITIGFLSNITIEKGILEFINLCDFLNKSGLKFRAIIAGPIENSIKHEILLEFSQRSFIEYNGAVYGVNKIGFFKDLDLFIFPSKYANEAEPLSVIEAIAHGAKVVVSNIGCLPELVTSEFGIVVDLTSKSWMNKTLSYIESNVLEEDCDIHRAQHNLRTQHAIQSFDKLFLSFTT